MNSRINTFYKAIFGGLVMAALVGCSGQPQDSNCQAFGVAGSGTNQPCGSGGASESTGGSTSSGGTSVASGGTASTGGKADTGGRTSHPVAGLVQKGPYILGTTITLQELDGALNPTGKSFTFQTNDDLGHFSIPPNVSSQFVEIIANGYYFDELSNQLSASQLTLRTLSDQLTNSTINVNLLTSLAASRERALVATGQGYASARTQAEHEVLSALNFTASTSLSFDQMDVSQAGNDNGLLLAASVLLEKLAYVRGAASPVAQLSQLLAAIASDIAADGQYDDAVTASTLRCVIPPQIDTSSVRNNLQSRLNSLGSPTTVPAFEQFLTVPSDCCAIDAKRCSGNAVQACDDIGRWSAGAACSGTTPYCKDGLCEAACAAGEKRCSATIAQTCDGSGHWQDNGHCSWSSPVVLREGYASHDAPEIAVDSAGNVTAVWDQDTPSPDNGQCAGVWSARYVPGSGWTTQLLTEAIAINDPLSVSLPKLAASATGEVMAVWQQTNSYSVPGWSYYYSTWARQFVPGTGWESAPTILEADALDSQQVNVTYANSTAVAVWGHRPTPDVYSYSIRTVQRAPASNWTDPQTIPTGADGVGGQAIRLANTQAGSIASAWVQVDGGMLYSDIRLYTSATGWSAPHLIGYGAPSATAFLAFGSSSDLLLTGDDSGPNTISTWSARYASASGWAPAELVEKTAVGYTNTLAMAMDAEGSAIAISMRSPDGVISPQIWARKYVPGVGWRNRQRIDASTWAVYWGDIAFDALGNATAVWEQFNPSSNASNIWVNRYRYDTGWGTPEQIRSVSAGGSNMLPVLAVDPKGRITVVWRETTNSSTFAIVTARFE